MGPGVWMMYTKLMCDDIPKVQCSSVESFYIAVNSLKDDYLAEIQSKTYELLWLMRRQWQRLFGHYLNKSSRTIVISSGFICCFYAPRKISGEHIVAGLSVRLYVPDLCPVHNFVFWSLILKLFHRNNHHIEMTCRAQHLGPSMTLQLNCVWPITSVFKVKF